MCCLTYNLYFVVEVLQKTRAVGIKEGCMEIEVRVRLISLGCIDHLSGESYYKAKQVNLCTTCLGIQIELNPCVLWGDCWKDKPWDTTVCVLINLEVFFISLHWKRKYALSFEL